MSKRTPFGRGLIQRLFDAAGRGAIADYGGFCVDEDGHLVEDYLAADDQTLADALLRQTIDDAPADDAADADSAADDTLPRPF